MKNNKNLVTIQGLKTLKEELKNLTTTNRRKIAEDIQRAKEFGDLSENAAYQAAVEARDLNESRIAELEQLINNAKVVSVDSKNSDIVSVGSTVVLKSADNQEITFTVVGIGESDPMNHKVASDTPLAEAVLGKKLKAKVVVDLPLGKIQYEIVKIK